MDYAANLALFLLDKTGTIFGIWNGRLTASEQRNLFGRFVGKGKIIIDGERKTICNRVKVCFGLDYDDRNITAWRAL
ncbi:hypothetical protein [Ferrovum myxofaciens]|uniref:hypothetical protein n=1 Tax=Ferrovum myxofaciens TaxID=416213 RepID=UPI003EB7CF0B